MRRFPRMLPWRLPGAALRFFLVSASVLCLAGRLVFASPRSPASSPPDNLPIPLLIEKSRAMIADLRVFVDFDEDPTTFAAWPEDKFGARLPADQIARGIRMGLLLWASVLPDMRFRMVQRESEANLIVRFAPYRNSGFADAGGRAFLPDRWAEKADGDCGRVAENRRPDGKPCGEWEHNIILMQKGRWAVKRADWRGMRETWLDFAWIFDPALPHYTLDGKCRDGKDARALWSDTCTPFRSSPAFDSLAGVDLAPIFQHEFGHTLMGDHAFSPYECADHVRRPVLSRDSCVRIGENGFTVMFPGDGIDAWWNRRGIFEGDAFRLKALGYRVSYPGSRAILILTRPGGSFLKTKDWREAQRAMIWPLQRGVLSPAQAKRELFLTDVELDP